MVPQGEQGVHAAGDGGGELEISMPIPATGTHAVAGGVSEPGRARVLAGTAEVQEAHFGSAPASFGATMLTPGTRRVTMRVDFDETPDRDAEFALVLYELVR